MEFGIALATAADSWKTVKHAGDLGFSHAWFYDTQMLCADCFVAMGAAADEALAGLPNRSPIPPELAEPVAGYVELAKTFTPAEAPYLVNHRGHLMAVKPIERPFVTAEMIRRTGFTGTEIDLCDRIAALRDGGYTQFTIQLVPGQEAAIEDWARIARTLQPR